MRGVCEHSGVPIHAHAHSLLHCQTDPTPAHCHRLFARLQHEAVGGGWCWRRVYVRTGGICSLCLYASSTLPTLQAYTAMEHSQLDEWFAFTATPRCASPASQSQERTCRSSNGGHPLAIPAALACRNACRASNGRSIGPGSSNMVLEAAH